MVRKNRQQVLSNGGRRWGFPPDEVHTRRERVHRVLFHSSVIYTYFGIRHAAAVSRLRVWLVLNHAVTFSWSTRHRDKFSKSERVLRKRLNFADRGFLRAILKQKNGDHSPNERTFASKPRKIYVMLQNTFVCNKFDILKVY